MKKRMLMVGAGAGIFFAAAAVAYAVVRFFFTDSDTTDFTKRTVFRFELSTGIMEGAEIGPGDSFSASPVIYNDATQEMYVFIVVQMPELDLEPVYTYAVDEDWILLESSNGTLVYAYADSEMIRLFPGEYTPALTEKMTMRSMTNAEYAMIDDINVTITGYAIGTADIDPNPAEAWKACKEIGNIN